MDSYNRTLVPLILLSYHPFTFACFIPPTTTTNTATYSTLYPTSNGPGASSSNGVPVILEAFAIPRHTSIA
ncbi:hypothetical protein K438DRAFT_1842361 [Mycena galopus ATCC 62051]|nr:hypothetical protein K438DRAFT_1842361 [Mycena galopus ATCC 62051]